MSGIAGIVNLDGRPVDRGLLSRMTESLAFRGPDAQQVWIDGAAGFGHTLLKTTDESEGEQQPFTLDGRAWIVADARVDARGELIAELGAKGYEVASSVPDVELILRAWCAWGEDCVDHLLGDFAFAIWDVSQRHLFCARDQMGIKPFFYAQIGSSIVFSNTLDCVRMHPSVSDSLNDLAVADFLLFDLNQDKATTIFADIQRIAPAHAAIWSEGGLKVRCYWTLPIDEPIYYRRLDDYADRFRELLGSAVGDRLRTDRIGIFMSGGLDSPTLAAEANRLLAVRSGDTGVRAFTMSYPGFDDERHFAGLVAKDLGIAVEIQDWDPNTVDPNWYESSLRVPEPVPYPISLAADTAYLRHVASYARVAFYGEGPDNALYYEWRPYFSGLVRRRRFGRLLRDLCSHAQLHGRLPVPSALFRKRAARPQDARPFFPDWLNPDFERRYQLRARWEHFQIAPVSEHETRPWAWVSLGSPQWQGLFDNYDAASRGSVLEVRHPFLDLRLLRYMLAVPPVPWCRSKCLMRRAMRGSLPEPVIRRPKSSLARVPWAEHVLRMSLPPLRPAPELGVYIDICRASGPPAAGPPFFWNHFSTRALNYWLQNKHPVLDHSTEEADELTMERLESQQTNQPVRKTYSKPHLQVYGNMREVTQMLSGMTGNDGSGVGNSKSSH